MKKIYLCFLTIFLVLFGCSSKQINTLDTVLKRGKLIVGYTEFPPMGYMENGNVIGFDIDLAKEVSKKLGVEVEFKYIDWNSKFFELESGRIDCIWNGLTITEDRLKEMEFSKKYLDNNLVILTLKSSNIETSADLNGKIIGVESTSSGQIALVNNKKIYASIKKMNEYDTSNSALLALKSGAIDAMIVDEIYARYYVLNKSDEFKIGKEIIGTEEYGIGFTKGNTTLKDKIDEILDELVASGVAQEISQKWFNTNLISR